MFADGSNFHRGRPLRRWKVTRSRLNWQVIFFLDYTLCHDECKFIVKITLFCQGLRNKHYFVVAVDREGNG